MTDDSAETDQWDDPHTNGQDVDVGPYIAGFFHGFLCAIFLEVFAVGAWFLIFEVVL